MTGTANTETNQTAKTINLPDNTQGVENNPTPTTPEQIPDTVPPIEVPGRPQTPEQVPEKSRQKTPA
jgi:hypothetical protein